MESYQDYLDDIAQRCLAIDCREKQRMLRLKLARDEDIVAGYAALTRQLGALCAAEPEQWSELLSDEVGEIVRDWSRQIKSLCVLSDLMRKAEDVPAADESVAARMVWIRGSMRWADVSSALCGLQRLVQDDLPPETAENRDTASSSPAPEVSPQPLSATQEDAESLRRQLEIAQAKIAAMATPLPAAEAPSSPKPRRLYRSGEVFRDFPEAPEMVVVPPGEFWMGSRDGERERWSDEDPRHLARIGYELAVGKFPVTFDEWDAFLSASDAAYRPADQGWGRGLRPVINVSWRDAHDYTAWLSEKTGQTYRLLSEAEWEYAARAGQGECRYPWGDDPEARLLPDHAWFAGNAGGRSHPVGKKPPNAFGLHDMHGNVKEWVEDVYCGNYHPAPDDGRALSDGGVSRVLRGGCWLDAPRALRSACRHRFAPDYRGYIAGFRVARVVQPR